MKVTPELLELIHGGTNTGLASLNREIFLLYITIAGTSFCDQMKKIAPKLKRGTVLKMIRHPKNDHDEMAIGIYYEDTRIGWVPMRDNLVISRLMDAGKAFFCRVQSKEWCNNWCKVDGKIYMVE